MKTYGINLDCNTPAQQLLDVPANSELQISPRIVKNGEMIDFSQEGAPGISAWCDGVQLSSDKTIDKSPCFKLITDNGGTSKVDVRVEDSGSFEICLRKSGNVYENDEVGGGGEIPADLSASNLFLDSTLTMGDRKFVINAQGQMRSDQCNSKTFIGFTDDLSGYPVEYARIFRQDLEHDPQFYLGWTQKRIKIGNRYTTANVWTGDVFAKKYTAQKQLDVGREDNIGTSLSTDLNGEINLIGGASKITMSGLSSHIDVKSPYTNTMASLKPLSVEIDGRQYLLMAADITPQA